MSSHSHHASENERESIKSLSKKLAQEFQSFSYRQLQHEAQLKERDTQFALLQEKLKTVKERDEYIKSKRSSHASSSRGNDSFGEQSLRNKEYYQSPPRRAKKERKESPREVRVELPHFYGKKMQKYI